MRWRKDGETIANSTGSMKLVLQLDTSDSSHTGVYTCEVVTDGMTLQANANVTVACKSCINVDVSIQAKYDTLCYQKQICHRCC